MIPSISVISPIYNMELLLPRCINSILAQTFNGFELILIDDGSTDRSGVICDEYATRDNRIKVIHKKNEGVSIARQLGIDLAQGEYTIHIDPDDWVEPEMLEELYKKAKDGHADMVICDYYVNQGNKEYHERQKPTALDATSVLHDVFNGLHANCWNKLIKKSCYTRYGIKFPTNISYREDFCVITQLLLHPIKISYIDKAFYHYVQNQTSISYSLNEKKLHDQLVVIDNIKSYLRGKYPECLNTLKADIACWLIESGSKPSKEVRAEFRDLLDAQTFSMLQRNRQIKILLSFYMGKNASNRIHAFISKIKSYLKNSSIHETLTL